MCGEEDRTRREDGEREKEEIPVDSQFSRGLLPILYKMDKKPDWKAFLYMAVWGKKEQQKKIDEARRKEEEEKMKVRGGMQG